MKFKIPRKLLIFISLGMVISLAFGFVFLDQRLRPILIPLGFCSLALFYFAAFAFIGLSRSINARADLMYRQTEALSHILSVLTPRLPLPSMRGWTILPDAAVIIVSQILTRKPKVIFECGSGVSTVLCGYAQERAAKNGKIFSIDHDAHYGEITRKNMQNHGFSPESYSVVHAPLVEHRADPTPFLWYDISFLSSLTNTIDLLIIDGPPHKTQYKARYPAMKFLYPHLSDNAVIILDDASRQDEKDAVTQWLSEHPNLKLEFNDTEKGLAVLIKTKQE